LPALQESTKQADSAPFIEFILQMILNSCNEDTPQVIPQVSPQVKRLVSVIKGEMSKEELMLALSLKDAKSFRQRYLLLAISNKNLMSDFVPAFIRIFASNTTTTFFKIRTLCP
jgi:hypothetical protein